MRQTAREVGISPTLLSRLEGGTRAPSVAVARDLIERLNLAPDLAERLLAEAVPDHGRSYPGKQR